MEPKYLSVPPDEDDEEFTITSERACVASTTVACWKCRSNIDVICLYCEEGIVSGEPLTQFTITHVWAVDSVLARQLEPWPMFREVYTEGGESSCFANHCPHCGSMQEDLYLHSEPGHPFFDIPHATPGAIRLTPLLGQVRLSGDESFEI